MIESSGLSDIGPVREDNQDALHLPDQKRSPETGILYAVADGMGGYANGAIASSLALRMLSETIYANNNGSSPSSKALRTGFENANLRVYKEAEHLGAGRMGTTLTAAYVLGDTLYLGHVGDSRAYLVRDRHATCLTSDHTTVGDLVRARLITPDKVRTHAQRSILTKAIGIGLFVRPDIAQYTLQEDDCLILCSDGVWSVIQDNEFAQVARQSTSADQVSKELVSLALRRETDDNATVLAVHIQKLIPRIERPVSPNKTGWLHSLRKLAR